MGLEQVCDELGNGPDDRVVPGPVAVELEDAESNIHRATLAQLFGQSWVGREHCHGLKSRQHLLGLPATIPQVACVGRGTPQSRRETS
jgi:hypothetical protein